MSRYCYKKLYTFNPSLAYCVGLIATDGSLSNSGRHIDFTSSDLALIETYKSIINPGAKVGTKKNGHGNSSFRVQVSDVALYDFLINTGLTPNKSLNLKKLNIPDKYYRDFLRGCFDGDGTAYTYKDTRWPSSIMYYMSLYSASAEFIDWIRFQNSKLAEVSTGSLLKKQDTTTVHRLNYAKADTKKLYQYMYYKDALPCLGRKRDKIASFFTDT